MNQQLKLEIKLNKTQYFWGESIFFSLKLLNNSTTPINVLTLEPSNRSLIFTLRNQNGKKISVNQMSVLEQEKNYTQPLRNRLGVTLDSKKSLKLNDDLLSLFGYIPQGEYALTVEYRGILMATKTKSIIIKVISAKIVKSLVSREGYQVENTPIIAIFEHQKKQQRVVFYQKISPYFPKNPRMSIFIDLPKTAKNIHVACLADKDCPKGHLYYQDGGKFFIITIDFFKKNASSPQKIKEINLKQNVLESGLSTKRGTLLLFTTNNNEFSLLEISESKEIIKHKVNLNTVSQINIYRCYWEQDLKLHFSWSEKDKKQLFYSQISLTTFKVSAKKIIYTAPEPIIWMEAYRDTQLKPEELKALYIEGNNDYMPSEPSIVFWSIFQKKNLLVCIAVDSTTGTIINSLTFKTKRIDKYRVVNSVMTIDCELALLLKNKDGKLYYTNIAKKKIIPISKINKKSSQFSQCPILLSSKEQAIESRIYLRYIKNNTTIEHMLLESL